MIKLKQNYDHLRNIADVSADPSDHDAAVAHALMQAIDEHVVSRTLLPRAEEILRDEFGIEE